MALTASVALTAASGCRCSEDRPYTPFGVTSALPEPIASASVAPVAPSASSSASAVEKALLAPRDGKVWSLAGRELAAPPGLVFEQGLSADFDGNGTTETATWLVAEGRDAGASPAGELWFYPTEGEARKLAKLPDFVPNGPNCKLSTTLARTGPHTLALDVLSTCSGALIARAPSRALLVIAPSSERSEMQMLRVASAAPDEVLELSTVTDDRDGDGRDDTAVTVSVGKSDGPRFGAPLVWLDRAFGPARDTSEPRVTLERLALHQATRAKTKKLADEVLGGVDGIRRLMSSLCAEGAVARVFDRDATPLPCGNLGAVIDSLASAEITAELARGAVLEAFGRLSRDGWYFGKSSPNARKRLERAVLDAVEPHSAEVSRVRVRPVSAPEPRYSPLAFDTDGSLLVATSEGVVRVGNDGAVGAPLQGGAPLPFDVSPSPERRFQSVAHSCDRSETTLLFTQGAPLVTSLLAPRPGACGRAAFRAFPPAAPLCAHSSQIAVLVGGSAVGQCSGSHPGSARSSDGKWVVVPTPFGLLIDGAAHRLLSLGNAIERPLELSDCVVAQDGRAAACLQAQQIVLARAPGS